MVASARNKQPRSRRCNLLCLAALEGDRLASGYHWGEPIQIWDLATKSCLLSFPDTYSHSVTCFAVLGNGLIAGNRGTTVKVWDIATGVCVATLRGHESGVHALAVLEDGQLAAASARTITLWDPLRSVVLE